MFLANLWRRGEVMLSLETLSTARSLEFKDKVIPDDGWRLLVKCLNQENALQDLSFENAFPVRYEQWLYELARGFYYEDF